MTLPVGQSKLTWNIEKVKVQGVYRGKPAPDFEVTTLDGQPFKLSALRGKVVLLDFWATWCGPCVAELLNVKKAYEEYAKDGLVVVGISFDRTAQTARDYVAKQELPWTQIWAEKGPDSPIANLYGVGAIPATFLIGPDGVVIDKDLRGEDLLRAVKRAVSGLAKSPSE
ncbi:MAG: TlpA disulfide reductase family protein [Phycisphaerae bacterium]|jgi:peroxiredoxin